MMCESALDTHAKGEGRGDGPPARNERRRRSDEREGTDSAEREGGEADVVFVGKTALSFSLGSEEEEEVMNKTSFSRVGGAV